MINTEVILISQFPLPYSKVGSWTTMYNYLLSKNNHGFNHIICPELEGKISNISYHILRDISILDKIKNKLLDSKSIYSNYLEALDAVIEKGKRYILHIIDNSGVVLPIDAHLKETYNREDFYIQYSYHGFAPIFQKKKSQPFFYAVNELFFLTNLSYKAYLNYYVDCIFKARVVHNAIDSNKFKQIPVNLKHQYRRANSIGESDIVFMWCSQDRPKKGLQIVLEAFKKIYDKNNNVQLLVVGINREINQEGVTIVGSVINDQLPKYYQMADVFLFPSLCKEGFGIVLAEALKCGCYCIASNQGGISEVLNNGDYGVLIDNPNFIDEWVLEMEKSIELLQTKGGNPYLNNIPDTIYDIENWASKITLYLEEAKLSLNMHSNED